MSQNPSKAQILDRLTTERRRLEHTLAKLQPVDLLQPGVVQHWSVKDVLAHLADWEARFLVWLEAARRGAPQACPDPNFTWKQIHQLNAHIYLLHREQALDAVLSDFRAVHQRFMQAIAAMPEVEMLTPAYHAFTEKAAIVDWLKGYANHDLWGKTKIRQWLKAQGR